MRIIEVKTQNKEELADITARVQEEISSSGIEDGLCVVFVPHTTAGITINENADPSVKEDLLMTMRRIVPDSLRFQHLEGNSPAHIKSTLIGCSEQLLVENGRLVLGTWQGIYFCEFDGPRHRDVFVNLLSEK